MTKRRRSTLWFGTAAFLAAIVALGATSLAATTYMGETGLLLAPSADTLGPGSFAIGYASLGLSNVVSFGMGLAPGLEVGVGSHGPSHDPSVYALLKLRLVGESGGVPALALGLEGEALYVSASKRLASRGPRVSAGFGTGRFDGLFLGLEHVLNPVVISSRSAARFPVTTLIGEYVGGELNVGARLDFGSGFGASVGLLGLNTVSAGVSFRSTF